jgi:transcriptional regulator
VIEKKKKEQRMFAYVELSVSLETARHRLVLRDHTKAQLQMSVWNGDEIKCFGPKIFKKRDKDFLKKKKKKKTR